MRAYKVHAVKTVQREGFAGLSDLEIEAVDATWTQFASMSAWTIRNWTHENSSEYTETQGRIPISYQQVVEALGDQTQLILIVR